MKVSPCGRCRRFTGRRSPDSCLKVRNEMLILILTLALWWLLGWRFALVFNAGAIVEGLLSWLNDSRTAKAGGECAR